MDALNDLRQFYEKVIEYEKLIQQWDGSLFLSGKLKEDIRGTDFQRDVFYTAFDSFSASSATARLKARNKVMPIVNEAIGKLEAMPLAELEAQGEIKKIIKESPIKIFDAMQFHPRIKQVIRNRFESGNYADAILAAFRAIESFIGEKTGSTLYGKHLMTTVFNEDNPIIQVPESVYFNKDVQEGFKFLFMGASQGIRNPKAHDEVIQNDPYITLEYLGFASFLLKRIDY